MPVLWAKVRLRGCSKESEACDHAVQLCAPALERDGALAVGGSVELGPKDSGFRYEDDAARNHGVPRLILRCLARPVEAVASPAGRSPTRAPIPTNQPLW